MLRVVKELPNFEASKVPNFEASKVPNSNASSWCTNSYLNSKHELVHQLDASKVPNFEASSQVHQLEASR